MKILTKEIVLAVLLLHFGGVAHSQERYFDYSGDDGCSPANIGHRLGGDFEQFESNSIEGMKGIASKQESLCFKNWEFDLSEWQGELFLSHDAIESSAQRSSLVSLTEFESEFRSIKATRPIVIDLKHISSLSALEKLVPFARNIRSTQKPEVWFLVSPDNISVLDKICSLVSGEFDVMLYRRGGEYCGRQ
jgi:hypothetical protein